MSALFATQHVPVEWSYRSGRRYDDPFHQVELDVLCEGPDGQRRLPGFWGGEQEWRVRFAPPAPGEYRLRSVCNRTDDTDLHGREMRLTAAAYEGDNPLRVHGPVVVSDDRRSLRHGDGKPFFFLADTWWMGLTARLDFPTGFQTLTADRKAKGFTAVLLVAGVYPEIDPLDPRGANEAGRPWQGQFERINPAWWDMADLRIAHLVREGIVPVILSGWGYALEIMGAEKMKQHWRTLVARWASYPVIWCLAGETSMPWYDRKDNRPSIEKLEHGWGELGRYVRSIDPYGRTLTTHPKILPSPSARDQVDDPALLDFDMLQTGHSGPASLAYNLTSIRAAYQREPTLPVVLGELNYEEILNQTHEEVQRIGFWASMLSGCCGFTYGANGIWQMNSPTARLGKNYAGVDYGGRSWLDAAQLPGSTQVGLGGQLLRRYPWWRLEPHPEWVHPSADENDPLNPYCAGIPGELRIIYCPKATVPWMRHKPTAVNIEAGVSYRAFYFDPRDGAEHPVGLAQPDAEGTWQLPAQPELRDWVLVMERVGS